MKYLTESSRTRLSGLALTAALTLPTACPVEAQTRAPEAWSKGVWEEECACYRNIDYGTATWFEIGRDMKQDFDFWPVRPGARRQPLIIFAHPGGITKTVRVEEDPDEIGNYDKLMKPARAAGFAVASIEFRHPVSNDNIVPPPHEDIITAIQFMRSRAAELGIDADNIFLMGSSRGTLTSWTGLQDDRIKPASKNKAKRQTSLVNAVFVYNAQTTYRGQEMADLFIVPAERRVYVASWRAEHPQDPLFGSAIGSVTPDDPPIWLNHEAAFFNHPIHAVDMTNHHPDFGPALCAAYVAAGIGDRCQAHDLVAPDDKWVGFTEFFTMHMK